MKLILPPIPGTNKNHPAFYVEKEGDQPQAWFHPGWPNASVPFNMLIRDRVFVTLGTQPKTPFSIIAAGYISRLWNKHYFMLRYTQGFDSEPGRVWEKIEDGSRDFDTCEIVDFESSDFCV